MTKETRVGTPGLDNPDDTSLATVVQFPVATADDLASTGDVIDADTEDSNMVGDADGEDHEAIVVPVQRKGPPVDRTGCVPGKTYSQRCDGRSARRPTVSPSTACGCRSI
jgi:hypothetical protein